MAERPTTTRSYWGGFRALCGLVGQSWNHIGNPPGRSCGTSCRGGAFRGSAPSAGRGRALRTGVRTSLSDKDAPRLTHLPRRPGHMDTHPYAQTHTAHLAPGAATLQLASVRGSVQRGRCAVPLRTAAAPSGIASRATVTRAAGGRRPQFQRWHTLRLYGTRHKGGRGCRV